jgi:non-specific serine/threonine protein kinase/serine/threonine-protein kinase
MNPERWQHVKQVLNGALALKNVEQPAYLDQACSGDPDLRKEVETLLQHHQRAESGFLGRTALVLQMPGAAADRPVARVGRRVGVYQLLEEIGQGGMGEVYRAARIDGQYEKQVAVKLVRGGFDTASVLERFRHERQILASLDHPNIARLLDGGTTEDGIPYLVMELIEGTPIDRHCDERGLSVSKRLELFRPVCAAIQYAHRHLVIHRDIKPSNILVTDDGIPKLLDFGIAKILDPSSTSEATLLNPLTPEYASPEQVRAEPITTASDVYSLAVVLYQLLTGHSPYQGQPGAGRDLARAICEKEPDRPSTAVLRDVEESRNGVFSRITPEEISRRRDGSPAKLHRRLVGDLDNLILKALRKEPERRYSSVEQFAEDIRCHLYGLPVIARKDSWSYRASKFVGRHTAAVAAALVVILTLAVGMAITLREKRIAERRFNDVRKLANSLIFEVHDSIRDLPGSTSARKLLVGRALEYLDSLSQEAKGDQSLQRELAAAYERVGDVLGHPYSANLGDAPGALQSYRKSLAIRESLAAARPDDLQRQSELAGDYFRIANLLESTGDLSGALNMIRKVLPITQRVAASAKMSPVTADQLAGGYYFTAGLLAQTGDPDGALENYRRAASVREEGLQLDGTNMNLRTHLAADYSGMAVSVSKTDLTQAVQMQNKAIEILEEVSREHPNSAVLREYLGEALNRLASFRKDQGDAAAALHAYKGAHGIFRDLVAADPNDSLAKANFGFTDDGVGEALVKLGKPVAALDALREGMATFDSLSPSTSRNRYVRTGLANSYSGLGRAYMALAAQKHMSPLDRRKRLREARSFFEKALLIWIDKEKRAELESDERTEPQVAAGNIGRCDSELGNPRSLERK